MHKENVVYVHNGVLVIKSRKEMLTSVAKWVGLEIIMLGEICQTQKDKYGMFFLICGS